MEYRRMGRTRPEVGLQSIGSLPWDLHDLWPQHNDEAGRPSGSSILALMTRVSISFDTADDDSDSDLWIRYF